MGLGKLFKRRSQSSDLTASPPASPRTSTSTSSPRLPPSSPRQSDPSSPRRDKPLPSVLSNSTSNATPIHRRNKSGGDSSPGGVLGGSPIPEMPSHQEGLADTPPRGSSLEYSRGQTVGAKRETAVLPEQQKENRKAAPASEGVVSEAAAKAKSLGCGHHDHMRRKEGYEVIKPEHTLTQDRQYLAPVLKETHHYHEVEEVSRITHHDRHTHTVLIHDQPILVPRKIVTRARIVVETKVLPQESIYDLTKPKDDKDSDALSLWLEEDVSSFDDCKEPGPYQAYAQAVHDRAVAMLSQHVSGTMAHFEKSLLTHPIIDPKDALQPVKALPQGLKNFAGVDQFVSRGRVEEAHKNRQAADVPAQNGSTNHGTMPARNPAMSSSSSRQQPAMESNRATSSLPRSHEHSQIASVLPQHSPAVGVAH